jgi:hypothetical protein
MSLAKSDGDDTVRSPPRHSKRAAWLVLVAVVLAALLGGSATVWLLRPRPAPTVATASAPAQVATLTPFDIITANEQEIAEHVSASLTVFRFASNQSILVLDFASLTDQGKMLNRIAAFAEKAGLPRDRVLTESELDAAIRERGDTSETFYFGHDYAAVALVRFFAAADRQGIELNNQEEKLRSLLRQVGWFAPEVNAGLISIPAVGTDPRITLAVRAGILRHELSHGEFFSNPSYAEYVRNFWLKELTQQERGGVRAFLGKDEYDVRVEELMCNEMQAYLMFTRDPALFTPDMAGLTQDRLAVIQDRFLAGMPSGWLRDAMAQYRTNEWAK